MNNNPFNIGFGQNDLRSSLAARGYKTAGEQAAERAAQAPKEEPKKEENNNTDQIASALGNRMLRDLGAAMINPVTAGFKLNGQMLKSIFAAPYNAMKSNGNKSEDKSKAVEGFLNAMEQTKQITEDIKNKKYLPEEESAEEPAEDDAEYVEYTYKPGDTFGQVILDLGLQTDSGLWGQDGDVAYYTQQLVDQGALDGRGNVPIGTTIKLKKRK